MASKYEPMQSGYLSQIFLIVLVICFLFCRWFALAEMHLFIVVVIRMFELKQLDRIPLPVSSQNH